MSEPRFGDEDLLTPAVAAVVARRSVRTIRRAYLGGALVAYRDASGRGVRIRYGDLKSWMMSEVVDGSNELLRGGSSDLAVGERRPVRPVRRESSNLALLVAARERRGMGGRRGE